MQTPGQKKAEGKSESALPCIKQTVFLRKLEKLWGTTAPDQALVELFLGSGGILVYNLNFGSTFGHSGFLLVEYLWETFLPKYGYTSDGEAGLSPI